MRAAPHRASSEGGEKPSSINAVLMHSGAFILFSCSDICVYCILLAMTTILCTPPNSTGQKPKSPSKKKKKNHKADLLFKASAFYWVSPQLGAM